MRLDQTAEGVFLELQRWTRRQLCSQWARVIMCWEFEGLFQISSQLLHLSALQTTRPLGLHATSRPFTIEGTRNCELGNCTSCIHTRTHTHTHSLESIFECWVAGWTYHVRLESKDQGYGVEQGVEGTLQRRTPGLQNLSTAWDPVDRILEEIKIAFYQ